MAGATDSGNLKLIIDAKSARALANLAQTAQRMERIKQKTVEGDKAGKKWGKTMEETAKKVAESMGFGGTVSAGMAGGLVAGAGVFSIIGIQKLFDFMLQKHAESLRKIREESKKVLEGEEKALKDASSIRNVSPDMVFGLRGRTGLGTDTIKDRLGNFQNEFGMNLSEDIYTAILNGFSKIEENGFIRDGTSGIVGAAARLRGERMDGVDWEEFTKIVGTAVDASSGNDEIIKKWLPVISRSAQNNDEFLRVLFTFSQMIGADSRNPMATFRQARDIVADGTSVTFGQSRTPEMQNAILTRSLTSQEEADRMRIKLQSGFIDERQRNYIGATAAMQLGRRFIENNRFTSEQDLYDFNSMFSEEDLYTTSGKKILSRAARIVQRRNNEVATGPMARTRYNDIELIGRMEFDQMIRNLQAALDQRSRSATSDGGGN